MKAMVLKEYKFLEVEEVPVPEIAPDEVLIRVKSVGICGSDVHGYDGSTGRRIPPVIMGHEASGVIEDVGKDVRGWKAGDRLTFDSTIYPLDDWYTRHGMYNLSDNRQVIGVSCEEFRRDGAFAEYVAVPQHVLYRLPDGVSFDQGALVEPFAVALHAAELASPGLSDSVVVVGAGIIGLSLIQILRAKGAGRIIAVDLDPEKLSAAREFGADAVIRADGEDVPSRVQELTSGRGADAAFEAVGISPTVATAVHSVRKGGTVVLVGNLSRNVELPLQQVVTRQIRVQGSCAICGEYPAVLEMISRGILRTEPVISATAPLEEGPRWFDRLYSGEKGVLKVILHP